MICSYLKMFHAIFEGNHSMKDSKAENGEMDQKIRFLMKINSSNYDFQNKVCVFRVRNTLKIDHLKE